MSARRQASLYYSRRRRRTRLNVPRLYQTGKFAPGSLVSGSVANQDLDRPITFTTKVDLAVPGLVFSWGSSLNLTLTPTNLTLTVPDGTVDLPHPGEGTWTIALSFRPGDGAAQLWNQYESLWRSETLTPGVWAQPDEDLTVGDNIIDFIGIYTAQLPRHFSNDGEISTFAPPEPGDDGSFWVNSTLLFMSGFKQPLFEGDV